jgi:putative SOS response-associated peptidase YedK
MDVIKMCGRFTLHIPPEQLIEIFGLLEMPVIPSRFNIAPSQQVAVIRSIADGHNRLDFLRWGLIPSWAKNPSIGSRMINAKCETVHEKPAFRHAIKFRRCVVVGSGFFEWLQEGKRKVPLYVRLKDGSPMCFAGIWEHWKSPEGELIESCSILTTTSNSLVAPLHDRMPVLLHRKSFPLWLDREITDPEKLKNLYQPYPSDLMEMYPVSPLVNSPRNDSPDLIEAVNPHSSENAR